MVEHAADFMVERGVSTAKEGIYQVDGRWRLEGGGIV